MGVSSKSENAGRVHLIETLGWLAAALAALWLAFELGERLNQPVTDFHSYFTAAHLVLEGKPIGNFYDDTWFSSEAMRFAPGLYEVYSPNPPTTALFYLPFGLFSTHTGARLVWTLLSIPLLIAFVEALMRISEVGSAARPFWYAIVLVSQPIQANFIQGQAYILIGLGLVLVFEDWQSRMSTRGGLTLGALLAYKAAGILVWPLALATSRWRLVFWALGVSALTVALTWPLVGFNGWSAYFHMLTDLSTSPSLRATAYQSIGGFANHLLRAGGNDGVPIVALMPETVRLFVVIIGAALLGITIYAAKRRPDDALVFGAGILISLIVVPVTLVHAYSLALISMALLIKRLANGPWDWIKIAAFGAALIILIPAPFRSARFFDGWLALLAYPKLYGALVLWTLSIVLILRDQDSPHAQALATS